MKPLAESDHANFSSRPIGFTLIEHRHYRHPRGDVVAGARAGQVSRQGGQLHLSPNGWPRRTEDPRAAQRPILTDICIQGADTKPDLNKAVLAHPYRGKLDSVNTMWADGHVETRIRSKLQHTYSGNAHSLY